MIALSASVVIDGEVGTDIGEPHSSWPGYVIVRVVDGNGYSTAISLYIAEDKARALIEQLTVALDAIPAAARG